MRNRKIKIIIASVFSILVGTFFSVSSSLAAIPKQINYQGKLTNTSDVAVADGNYSMKISIYDSATGGSCLWTARGSCGIPTARTVAVANGIFSIMLGDTVAGDNAIALDFNTPYYLGVTVEGDAEMGPARKMISASGYAFNSDLLDGLDSATTGATAHILATDASGNATISGNTYFNGTTYYVASTGTGNLNDMNLAGDLDVKGADIRNTTGALTVTPLAGTNLNVALSSTGDFAVNTNQLYVDTSTGNVGIGTTAPSQLLSVGSSNQFTVSSVGDVNVATVASQGAVWSNGGGGYFTQNVIGNNNTQYFSVISAGVERMRFDTAGNVGIGTTAPTTSFQVAQGTAGTGTVATNGTTTLTGTNTQFTNTFKVGDTITVSGETVRTIATIPSDTSLTVTVAFSTTASGLSYTLVGGTRFSVLGNGNVGIGTTSPSYPLDINSSAIPTRFNTTANGTYNGLAYMFAPNLTTGNNTFFSFGRDVGANNAASIGYTYVGNNSTSNRFTFNFASGSELMSILASGNVGIGTTSPAGTLDILGKAIFTPSVADGATAIAYKFDTSNTLSTAGARMMSIQNNGVESLALARKVGQSSGYDTVDLLMPSAWNEIISNGRLDFFAGGSAGTGQMYFHGSSTQFASPLNTTRMGDATSTATQADAYPIVFQNSLWNGTSAVYATSNIRMIASTTVNQAFRMAFRLNGTSTVGNDGSEYMTILSSGNVGIGTTTPGDKLEVSGGNINASTGGSWLKVNASDSGVDFSNGTTIKRISSDGHLQLNSQNSKIELNGSVGIGITAPTIALDVKGASNNSGISNVSSVARLTTSDSASAGIGGGMLFAGAYTGTTVTDFGYIGGQKENASAGDYSGKLVFGARANGGAGGDMTRMTILGSTGNVGIGTTTPTSKLTVSDTNRLFNDYPNLAVMTSDAQAIDKGGRIGLGGNADVPIEFGSIFGRKENVTANNRAGYLGLATYQSGIGPTEWMRITSTGNVGIGTTVMNGKFNIQGASVANPTTLWSYGYITDGTVDTRTGTIRNAFDTNSGYSTYWSSFRAANGSAYKSIFGLSAGSGDVDVLTLQNNGNVGIGTTGPGSKLEVVTSSTGLAGTFTQNGDGYGVAINSSGTSATRYALAVRSADTNTPYLYVTTETGKVGNVGIGTVSPGARLEVKSSAASTYIEKWSNSGGTYVGGVYDASGYGQLYLANNAGVDKVIFATAGDSYLNGGNVGIGTTAPGYLLDVSSAGANADGLRVIKTAGAGIANIYLNVTPTATGNARNWLITTGYNAAGNLEFRNGGSEGANPYTDAGSFTALTINKTGNVGIGTTSPGYKLEVVGGGFHVNGVHSANDNVTISSTACGLNVLTFGDPSVCGNFTLYSTSGTNKTTVLNRTSGGDIQFTENNGTAQMIIKTGGNVGIGTIGPNGLLQLGSNLTATTLWMSGATETATQWNTLNDATVVGNGGPAGITVHNNNTTDGNWSRLAFSTYEGATGNNIVGAMIATRFTSRTVNGWANGDLAFFTNAKAGVTERMRIQNDGNVGIGTSGPGYKLEVSGTTGVLKVSGNTATAAAPLAYLVDAATGYSDLEFFADATNFKIGPYADKGIQFVGNSGTEVKMTLDNNGNVGIGTTTPGYKLDVNGTFRASGVSYLNGATIYSPVNPANYVTWTDNSTQWVSGSVRTNMDWLRNAFFGSSSGGVATNLNLFAEANYGDIGQATGGAIVLKGTSYSNDGSIRMYTSALGASAERMTILSGGNVGIGTTNPGYKLEVSAPSNLNGVYVGQADSMGTITAEPGGTALRLKARAGNQPDLVVATSGNVGIGTTAPYKSLDVRNTLQVANADFNAGTTVGSALWIDFPGAASGNTYSRVQAFYSGSGAVGVLSLNPLGGNVGIGTTAPNAIVAGQASLDVRGSSYGFLEVGSTANVTSTDVGYLEFMNSNQVRTATIAGGADGTNQLGYLRFSTATGGAFTERMRINSSGNVGIGTTLWNSAIKVTINTSGTGATYPLMIQNAATPAVNNSARFVLSPIDLENGSYTLAPYIEGIEEATGNNTMGLALGTYNGSTLAERIRIAGSGNVGIGNTSPNAKLDILNSGTANTTGDSLGQSLLVTGANLAPGTNNAGNITVATNDTLGADVGGSIAFAGRYSTTQQATWSIVKGGKENATSGAFGGYLAFFTRVNGGQPTERMRVDPAGNVGIGITNPGYLLTVNGQPAANGYTAFTNYSDARLKENITDITNGSEALSLINQLRPVTFNYNALTGYDQASRNRRVSGFIAQELQTVFPEMVGTTMINGTQYLDTNISDLPLYLVKAVQQLNQTVTDKNTQNDAVIASLSLKTDTNITTLAQLQTSVDAQLTVIGSTLSNDESRITNLEKKTKDQETTLATLSTSYQLQATSFQNLQTDMNTQASKITLLETQMQSLIDFYTTFNMGNIIAKDALGNVDLGAGILKAGEINSGSMIITKFFIENKDIGSEVIGDATIPLGETKIVIPTKGVVKGSHVLVTPRVATGESLAVTTIKDGESFTVEVLTPTTSDLPFQWWIIEKK